MHDTPTITVTCDSCHQTVKMELEPDGLGEFFTIAGVLEANGWSVDADENEELCENCTSLRKASRR